MNSSHSFAKGSLHELVRHVFSSYFESLRGITYQELARRIGRINKHGVGHGHGMGKVLGEMGHLLEQLEGEWGEPIPHIQSLVINKQGPLTGLPDEGIREFWPKYPDLSKQEKLNKVHTEYNRILEFGSRWNKVLSDLGLEIIKSANQDDLYSKRAFGRTGESPEHLALKNYVCSHSELVGAGNNDKGYIEYSFPSLDTVDVLFKSPNRWIAVEVKSCISDNYRGDFERGIYQCVKYRALLEAMYKDEHYSVPENVQVVLLLETSLPDKYKSTASDLGVDVIEGISVPKVPQ